MLVAATHGRSMWRLDLAGLPLNAPPASPVGRVALSPSSPNPSAGAVAWTLELPAASRVDAAIYDAAGRRVAPLESRAFAAGRHRLAWDGRTAAGARVAPGVYFARVDAGGAVAVRRVVRAE
jgi:flagellar hook assembly protein FlgD